MLLRTDCCLLPPAADCWPLCLPTLPVPPLHHCSCAAVSPDSCTDISVPLRPPTLPTTAVLSHCTLEPLGSLSTLPSISVSISLTTPPRCCWTCRALLVVVTPRTAWVHYAGRCLSLPVAVVFCAGRDPASASCAGRCCRACCWKSEVKADAKELAPGDCIKPRRSPSFGVKGCCAVRA